jgi:hypothetical protein
MIRIKKERPETGVGSNNPKDQVQPILSILFIHVHFCHATPGGVPDG